MLNTWAVEGAKEWGPVRSQKPGKESHSPKQLPEGPAGLRAAGGICETSKHSPALPGMTLDRNGAPVIFGVGSQEA